MDKTKLTVTFCNTVDASKMRFYLPYIFCTLDN